MILGLSGIFASYLYSSSAFPLSMRKWVLPTRVYETLGRAVSPLMGQNRPFRRSNIVTYEEALLESLGVSGTEEIQQILGTGPTGEAGGRAGMLNVGGGGGNAVRRRSAVQLDRATPSQSPRPNETAPPPPAARSQSRSRLPPISGASFLSQWQAGLSGGSSQPSSE